MVDTMIKFSEWCGLPEVVGAIDGRHFQIKKPTVAQEDYFYLKINGYSTNCQTVVNKSKRFFNVYVGMPYSVNKNHTKIILHCIV